MRTLIAARHAHAASNASDTVSCIPPGEGLAELGIAEAINLRKRLAELEGEPGRAREASVGTGSL